MNPRYLLFAAGALMLLETVQGSQPPRDLGQGLSYYRVHELPTDLPTPPAGRPGTLVLDLRYAKADPAAAATLKAWVLFNASPRAPIFVLENSETAYPLRAALAGNGPAGLLILAPVSAKLAPDIEVNVSASADRDAYMALEKGAAVESLLSDYPDKPRMDEAYLEKEHLSDSDAPGVPADGPMPAQPRVDPLLQRAVHLHQGLLALKRP